MGKTTIKKKANNFVVVNKLTKTEIINEREIINISTGLVQNLIPISKEKSLIGKVLKCSFGDKISLKAYFSGNVDKQTFMDVILKIIEIVKQCEKNLMNVNNLMLHMDYIFIDPSTKKVSCIFWPLVNNQTTHVLADFFSELTYSVVFNKEENLDYVSNYLQYFNRKSFSLNSFEELIRELTEMPLEKQSRMQSSNNVESYDNKGSQNGTNSIDSKKNSNVNNLAFHSDNYQTVVSNTTKEESKICSNCEKVYNVNTQCCTNCGYPLPRVQPSILVNIQNHISPNSSSSFTPNGYIGLPNRNSQSISETTVLDEGDFGGTTVLGEEDFGGTTVLGEEDLEEPSFPYLIREKTQEQISVNKPSFRIGKEKSFCDYFVIDNNAVSRSHADIITKGDRFFIVDNNSTNKTYVDNRAIPVKQEVEIFSGTKLKFANEEFVFYI